jgi:hypothetical protein
LDDFGKKLVEIPLGMTDIVAPGEAERNPGIMKAASKPSAVANQKKRFDLFGRKKKG